MLNGGNELDDFILTVADVQRELDVSRPILLKWRKEGATPEFQQCALTGKIRYSARSVIEVKKEMHKN